MSAGATPQRYANHRRLFPLFHFVVQPLLLANLGVTVAVLARGPSLERGWAVVVAAALLLVSGASRVMVLTVQNRVVRLEQRLRLARLLAPAEQAAAEGLGLARLLALRFAGDDELPGLVRRAAAGELATADAVKRAIVDWQPDHLRA